ncbi:MerR family transcriptional regulator [Streptosporangium sp. 'caverna']|uniref:helix-turn-helix domain-containing protein n=1 Tax=Streptosporangium sp. 'caverna' TaxID=2202249 RepID=UPI000D7E9FC4|nr:MerR family transcriptional regulator [Streptosporangium sp. 'caverna']AWS44665.1 MerR family transcriptional regulator [Streptosporangium sp. 'caverna']
MKSSGDVTSMAIGEIAERFGLAAHVLRHWESMGLLAPARVEGDRRRYGRDDLYRVAVILRAKEAGFSLDDIREMIATGDPDERRDILLRRHADLTRRIAEAQASLHLIECALDCDHADFTGCTHFQDMVAERIGVGSPLRVRA